MAADIKIKKKCPECRYWRILETICPKCNKKELNYKIEKDTDQIKKGTNN